MSMIEGEIVSRMFVTLRPGDYSGSEDNNWHWSAEQAELGHGGRFVLVKSGVGQINLRQHLYERDQEQHCRQYGKG